MKIVLKKLSLTNFKGIRSMIIIFDHVTNILGQNATGKTSLMDGFLWLLFGKDSTDRKDFEIKTLDENNNAFHKLDHEVSAIILVDGEEITLRRVLKEKWVTKRGETTQVFSGHSTEFFWNDVPFKENEYQAKIAGLLNENIFKVLTNTTYFNSLKWQERRNVLTQIAGSIDNSEILMQLCQQNGPERFEDLINALNKKTVEEYKKEIASKKKILKDSLLVFPSRIDEANRSLPEEKDYDEIEKLIASLNLDIDNVDGLLSNKTQAQKEHQRTIGDLMQKKQNLSRMLMDIEFDTKNKVKGAKQIRESNILSEKSELRKLNDDLLNTRKDYTNSDTRKKQLVNEQDGLREKWNLVNDEKLVFNEGEFCCPACKREYETSDIEAKKLELTSNFNSDKSKRLIQISERGTAIAKEVGDIEIKLSNLKAKGEDLNSQISITTSRIAELEEQNNRLSNNEAEEVEKSIVTHTQYQQYKQEVAGLEETINTPYQAEDNSQLLQRKKELNTQLQELNSQLSGKGLREKQLTRITELTEQEAKMANELAGLEGIEFGIQQFEKAQMSELEKRVNGRFKIAQFKLFETQINGGESPCCITLIKGVPYEDANTASKIQAGLDIINVLNDHYGVQAPVWVDNRESVISLPETNSQLINLIVSAQHKKLTVEEGHEEMAMA